MIQLILEFFNVFVLSFIFCDLGLMYVGWIMQIEE